ncbi:hypothetical protein VZC37_17880 [Gordonia sp. LSe1-13]|uniref:Uncharacterized protein n=1 Tax=Gordonia sesuvii TaxID=3116777 RepID=A0ABU7MGH0_9ACTN|nr:hypothetical protein [Gordonia sp. LSe1-13]
MEPLGFLAVTRQNRLSADTRVAATSSDRLGRQARSPLWNGTLELRVKGPLSRGADEGICKEDVDGRSYRFRSRFQRRHRRQHAPSEADWPSEMKSLANTELRQVAVFFVIFFTLSVSTGSANVWMALVGAAIGAVLWVLITRGLDYLQTKVTHRRERVDGPGFVE